MIKIETLAHQRRVVPNKPDNKLMCIEDVGFGQINRKNPKKNVLAGFSVGLKTVALDQKYPKCIQHTPG